VLSLRNASFDLLLIVRITIPGVRYLNGILLHTIKRVRFGFLNLPLGLYTRESVNRSQIDIKGKTCDIEPEENIYFSTYPPPALINLSHRFTIASKPAA
jgi:hypothetical protein